MLVHRLLTCATCYSQFLLQSVVNFEACTSLEGRYPILHLPLVCESTCKGTRQRLTAPIMTDTNIHCPLMVCYTLQRDGEDANLLSHLPAACRFIQAALHNQLGSRSGGCLCLCVGGIGSKARGR